MIFNWIVPISRLTGIAALLRLGPNDQARRTRTRVSDVRSRRGSGPWPGPECPGQDGAIPGEFKRIEPADGDHHAVGSAGDPGTARDDRGVLPRPPAPGPSGEANASGGEHQEAGGLGDAARG